MDNTFSIVGRCSKTGALGVAVATARLAVGSRVPYARGGVGAIATQADTNVYLAYEALKLLEKGVSAPEALEGVLAADEGKERRQLTIIDSQGNKAAFTGGETEPYQGHLLGEDCIAAGNMLTGPEVLQAMIDAFRDCQGFLGERLLGALEAGQLKGGDKRGKLSAALIVVQDSRHPLIDLRIDRHHEPVQELRVLFDEYKNIFLAP